MAQCQKCNAPLEGDFGVINCIQCGEVNFLDEGPVRLDEVTRPASKEVAEPAAESAAWEPPPFAIPDPVDVAAEPPAQKTQSVSLRGDKTQTGSRSVVQNTKTQSPQEAINEIATFGNQEKSSADTGILLYEVQITGIDTLEMRKSLLDILRDPKFRWNVDSLENSITSGALLLQGLTPIKASILIKKIRHLDLEIRWRQGSVYEAPAT